MPDAPDDRTPSRSSSIRRWAIRIGVAVVVAEIVYVVAANAFLRSGMLLELINKKPEKMTISWDSAVTYLPGVASVENFELRSQTRKDQIYLRVGRADARISLLKLALKTIHIRGVDADGADFRYRERLDRPPRKGQEEEPRKEPETVEYWPEIPGYSNPPEPKPEEIYELKKKKRPWTIKITGAEVEGPIRVALNHIRIEGDGLAGGGVTVKPRRTIRIHRGLLDLASTRVTIGPDVVAPGLEIAADIEIDPFPAKGAKIADVLGGISGEFSLEGRVGDRVAVRHVITPGISTYGAGTVDIALRLKDGAIRKGSEYSLESESFTVGVMGLDATGSARVTGRTEKEGGDHLSTAHIALGGFSFVDPDDGSESITGDGLELDATWIGLSIAEKIPASFAALSIPHAMVHDVSIFNDVIPDQSSLRFGSGTGEVSVDLEVNDRVANGTLNLDADDIVLETKDVLLRGDFELQASLAEGDLETRRFDFSGTALRLDNLVNEELSEKKQGKLDAWFCEIEIDRGNLIIGRPLAADGDLRIEMHDSRPVLAMLKDFGVGPGWLSVAPNIKDIEGTLNLELGDGIFAFEDLDLTGDGFEALGWMHVENKKGHGRLFARFKSVMAGVSLDGGKAKIHLKKPRRWFEGQPQSPRTPPVPAGEPATAGGSS